MKGINTKKITKLALITALALITFMLENLLPPVFVFAPGTKLGLASVFVNLAFILYGKKEALIVLVIKCVLGAVFSGNMFSLYYSVPAGLLSLAAAIALFTFVYNKIGVITISVFCAVIHNITQIVMAVIITGTSQLIYYSFLAGAAGIIAGIITGLTLYIIIKNIH